MGEINNFGERIMSPNGRPVIKRKKGEINEIVEKKAGSDTPKFNITVDKNEKMFALPVKGNSEEEQKAARKILEKLQEEKNEFYKKRAARGFKSFQ
jgi:hypothetical protein